MSQTRSPRRTGELGSFEYERRQFKQLLDTSDHARARTLCQRHPDLMPDSPESFYKHAVRIGDNCDDAFFLATFEFLKSVDHDPALFADDALSSTLLFDRPAVGYWLLDHGALMRPALSLHYIHSTLQNPIQLDIDRAAKWKTSNELKVEPWLYLLLAGGGLLGQDIASLDAVAAKLPQLDDHCLWIHASRWIDCYGNAATDGQPAQLEPTVASAAWLRNALGDEKTQRLVSQVDPAYEHTLGHLRSALDHDRIQRQTPLAPLPHARRGL